MLRSPIFLPLFFVLLILSGCGREQERSEAELGKGNLRWASFPVDIRVDSFLLQDSNAVDDLNDAMRFWETKAGKPLFRLVGGWDNSQKPYTGPAAEPQEILANVIFFEGPWPFDSRIAGKTIVHSSNNLIENSIIFLNSDTHLCSHDCSSSNGDVSRRKLIAHELGHFVGLGHSTDTSDVMYPEILDGGSLTELRVNTSMLQYLTN